MDNKFIPFNHPMFNQTADANASNGSAGAKPVRNPEREKPKWEVTVERMSSYRKRQ